MFKSIQGPQAKSRILAAAAVAAAVGLTACAASGGAPAAAPATTVTQTAQASPPPAASSPAAAPSAPASGSADSSSAGRLPDYQPSTVVSKTVVSKSVYSVVLMSPDSVGKIGEFYRNALATGGWHVTSSSTSAYHASLAAYRSNEGVNVSVYSRGSGSGISINTHSR